MTTTNNTAWGIYKESLLDGLDSKQKAIIGTVMENSHSENTDMTKGRDVNFMYEGADAVALAKQVAQGTVVEESAKTLTESTAVGSTVTSNISRYDTMFMPLIRRVMPALLAMDLVGVQPINSPQGIVRTLRMRYSESTDDTNGGTELIAAGTEASGQVVFDKYSQLALGGDYDEVDALNPFDQTVYLEGNRGKPMDLEVVTDRVTMQQRKLSATYSLEAADDLNALDGLDIEQELTQSLGDEILRELDRQLLNELSTLAGTVEAFDFALVDGRYAGERLAALSIAIDNLSAQIAMNTRKSGATWMVVSQRVFTALKHASNGSFVPANANGSLNISTSLFVGTFGGNVKVYVDPYAITDTVLMGYKGSELDSGLIYSPYIPLSSSGVVPNPETGDHRINLRTRYGLHSFTDTATSLGDSPDYFARANIANINLGFVN